MQYVLYSEILKMNFRAQKEKQYLEPSSIFMMQYDVHKWAYLNQILWERPES